MTKCVVGALVGLCMLSACAKKTETADTATIPGIDTTKSVVSIPITDSVPGAIASKNDSARAKAAHDSAKAGHTTKAKLRHKRR